MDDEEVLKLKEKLSQCRLERERLLQERQRWRINEKLVQRGIEKVEEKLKVEIEANSCAASEFEVKKKTLQEALETKTMSAFQLQKVSHELVNSDNNYLEVELANVHKDLARVDDEAGDQKALLLAEMDNMLKLESVMTEKQNDIFEFLDTCEENLKITDDLKPLIRVHYEAYANTVKSDDEEYECLIGRLYYALQLYSAPKQHQMFAGVDFISPVSTAMSKVFNSFLRKKTESNGTLMCEASSTEEDANYGDAFYVMISILCLITLC